MKKVMKDIVIRFENTKIFANHNKFYYVSNHTKMNLQFEFWLKNDK